MKRTRRLDQPLYKLEWYDSALLVWRPLQKLYPSIEDAARITRTDERVWRLMEVSQHGYRSVTLP